MFETNQVSWRNLVAHLPKVCKEIVCTLENRAVRTFVVDEPTWYVIAAIYNMATHHLQYPAKLPTLERV